MGSDLNGTRIIQNLPIGAALGRRMGQVDLSSGWGPADGPGSPQGVLPGAPTDPGCGGTNCSSSHTSPNALRAWPIIGLPALLRLVEWYQERGRKKPPRRIVMPHSRTAVAPPPRRSKLAAISLPRSFGGPSLSGSETDSHALVRVIAQQLGRKGDIANCPRRMDNLGWFELAFVSWGAWGWHRRLQFQQRGRQPAGPPRSRATVYVDANNNGKADTGEPRLGGVTVDPLGNQRPGQPGHRDHHHRNRRLVPLPATVARHLQHHRDRPDRLRRRQGHHRHGRRHGRARHVHRHRAGVGRQRHRLRLRLGARAGVHQHGGHTGRRGRVVFLPGDGDRRRRRHADILAAGRPQHHDRVRGRPGLLGPRHQRRRHAPDRAPGQRRPRRAGAADVHPHRQRRVDQRRRRTSRPLPSSAAPSARPIPTRPRPPTPTAAR